MKHVRKHQQRNPLTRSRFQVIIHLTTLWGIDVLELTDVTGQKYQVLNMVCIGTCFQQAEVVKVGAVKLLRDPVWTHS